MPINIFLEKQTGILQILPIICHPQLKMDQDGF